VSFASTGIPLPAQPNRDVRVISLIGLAHGLSHFYQILIASLFAFISPDLGLSYTQLGVLIALFFAASGVGQVVSGFAVDAFGGRRLLIGGLMLCGLAHVAAGLASGFTTLAVAALFAGIGNSVFHPADFSLMNHLISPRRLSWAFSLHAISGNIGYVISPIFAVAAQKQLGWQGALLLAGGAGIALALWLIFEPSLRKDIRNKSVSSTAGLSAKELIAPLLSPVIFMAFAFFGVTTLYSVSISSFGPALFRDVHGHSIEQGTLLLSLYLVSQTMGMLLGGWIGSTGAAPGRTASIATFAAGFVACGLFFAPLPLGWLTAILFCVGLCVGVVSPSRDLLIKKVAPKHALGRAYGVVYSGFDIGASIAPIIYGSLIDRRLGCLCCGFVVFKCVDSPLA
jgi:MFS transporter, FSR family, fosmidomycin resistance protein